MKEPSPAFVPGRLMRPRFLFGKGDGKRRTGVILVCCETACENGKSMSGALAPTATSNQHYSGTNERTGVEGQRKVMIRPACRDGSNADAVCYSFFSSFPACVVCAEPLPRAPSRRLMARFHPLSCCSSDCLFRYPPSLRSFRLPLPCRCVYHAGTNNQARPPLCRPIVSPFT